jgi:hypothetical protein
VLLKLSLAGGAERGEVGSQLVGAKPGLDLALEFLASVFLPLPAFCRDLPLALLLSAPPLPLFCPPGGPPSFDNLDESNHHIM